MHKSSYSRLQQPQFQRLSKKVNSQTNIQAYSIVVNRLDYVNRSISVLLTIICFITTPVSAGLFDKFGSKSSGVKQSESTGRRHSDSDIRSSLHHDSGISTMERSKSTRSLVVHGSDAKGSTSSKGLFGKSESKSAPKSLFGRSEQKSSGSKSLFGRSEQKASSSKSLFGRSEQKSSSSSKSLFGQKEQKASGSKKSMFGRSESQHSSSLSSSKSTFGPHDPPASSSSSSKGLFGRKSQQKKGSSLLKSKSTQSLSSKGKSESTSKLSSKFSHSTGDLTEKSGLKQSSSESNLSSKGSLKEKENLRPRSKGVGDLPSGHQKPMSMADKLKSKFRSDPQLERTRQKVWEKPVKPGEELDKKYLKEKPSAKDTVELGYGKQASKVWQPFINEQGKQMYASRKHMTENFFDTKKGFEKGAINKQQFQERHQKAVKLQEKQDRQIMKKQMSKTPEGKKEWKAMDKERKSEIKAQKKLEREKQLENKRLDKPMTYEEQQKQLAKLTGKQVKKVQQKQAGAGKGYRLTTHDEEAFNAKMKKQAAQRADKK